MNERVKAYALQPAVGYIHCRSYEPKGFTMAKPVFGIPALLRFPLAPKTCAICDADVDIPARMDWINCFGNRPIISICFECTDCTEEELEQALLEKLGLQPAEVAVAAE